jgi:hypothetical protein
MRIQNLKWYFFFDRLNYRFIKLILTCIAVTITLSQIHKHAQIAITNLKNIDKLLTSVTKLLTCRAPVLSPEQRRENDRRRRGKRDGVDAVDRYARRPRSTFGAGARPPRSPLRPRSPHLRCTRWHPGASLGRPLLPRKLRRGACRRQLPAP